MDATIRNVDPEAYRALKARAAAEGVPMGEALSRAIWGYVGIPRPAKRRSLLDAPSFDLGPGTERLSEQVDEIVYGI